MDEHKTIMEEATSEGIKAIIGAGKRYKDLGDFWTNVESMRNVPTVVAFEGISFEMLDKLLPVLERELGYEVKTAEIQAKLNQAKNK